MGKGYPDDWDDRRKAVYQRDGYSCQMCGIGGGKKGGATLDVHHIMPKSKGGQHQPHMLLTLCRYCHGRMDYFMESPNSPRDCFIKSVSSPVLYEAKHEAGRFKKGPIIPAIRYAKPDGSMKERAIWEEYKD